MASDIDKFSKSIELLIQEGLPEDPVLTFIEHMVHRHQERWRHYHGVDHPADVSDYIVTHARLLDDPVPAVITGIGHDAIMVPPAPKGVNEELTAQLLEDTFQPILDVDQVEQIGSFTRASANHTGQVGGTALHLFLDADLKILGAPPDEFQEYDTNVWHEYEPFYDRASYLVGRHRVLRIMLFTNPLFKTTVARDEFEMQAVENLVSALLNIANESTEGLSDWNETIEGQLDRSIR
jgi:predicted metal-dependent HD superfamily phosphohydrolase